MKQTYLTMNRPIQMTFSLTIFACVIHLCFALGAAQQDTNSKGATPANENAQEFENSVDVTMEQLRAESNRLQNAVDSFDRKHGPQKKQPHCVGR